MTSTCRIHTAGELLTNLETGEVTHAEVDPVTTKCRVRPNGTQAADTDSGAAEVIASGYVVSVPFAITPKVLQRLVVETSPDPSLVGLSLEVRQIARGDHITARRLLCVEVA